MIKLEWPLLLLAVLVPLLGAFALPLLGKRVRARKLLLSLTSFAMLLVPPLVVLALAVFHGLEGGVVDPPFFQHPAVGTFSMYLDWLSGLYILGIAAVTPLVAVYSRGYMEHRIREMRAAGLEVPSLGTFFMLYTLFSAAMSGVVFSTNLIQFYIFLKLTVVASFFLILLYGYGERYRIAFMYLIWSSLAGFAFLLGSLGLGAGVGSFDILDLSTLELNMEIGEGLPIIIPLLIFVGLQIKKAIFGFHIWLPYAHAEAPTPVSALLSPNLIGISGWAMLRIVYEMFPAQFETMSMLFFVLAYVTMVYGGLMALAQEDLKRLLAYISVSQMGWVVLGFTTLTTEGMVGGVLLFVKHSLSLSILFMGAGLLISRFGGLRKITNMKGLWRKAPILSALMTIGFLILVGAPLTVGFWTKTLIFSGAVKMPAVQSWAGFILVATLLVVAGSITAAYSFLTLKRIMPARAAKPGGEKRGANMVHRIGWDSATIPMAVLAALGILLFFFPTPLIGQATLPPVLHIVLEGAVFIAAYVAAYYVFQGWPQQFSVWLFRRFETGVIDRLVHKRLVAGIHVLSNCLQGLHSGLLNTYMFWMVSGFLMIVFFLLLV